ncbi:hypothetical protein GCM10010921_07460 [Microbacterium album]|uniref:D-inositol 3-phosphate glycosyltransferase n=1 Tax=Microbacterium album TaxID=2053191 RepID=A0A917MKQ2_9MICO|nr:hypothetical protein GCM10010921_07460 [Microbacterium album]
MFPSWGGNPFLNVLALAPRAAGHEFVGATTFDELLRGFDALRREDVFHLHWTTPLLQQASTRDEAVRRLAVLQRAFRDLGARGVRIVWTVHNRLPHEIAHRDLEVEFYRVLNDTVHAIHVMSPATASALSDIVALSPEKIRVLPHPSYEGLYDSGLTPLVARRSFDLRSDERAVLFIGQIRPYKGVEELIRAALLAQQETASRRLVLMLAGEVKEMSRRSLVDSLPTELRMITHLDFVPDADVERWLLAADLAVFPYRAILNSGSVHLAASFTTPVVLPDLPHLRTQYGSEPWVSLFDPAEPVDSIAALLADPRSFDHVDPSAFRPFLDRTAPWRISSQYAELLTGLTGTAGADGAKLGRVEPLGVRP